MNRYKIGDKVRLVNTEGLRPWNNIAHGAILTVNIVYEGGKFIGFEESEIPLKAKRFELANELMLLDDDDVAPLMTVDQGNAIAECATESAGFADILHEEGMDYTETAAEIYADLAKLEEEIDGMTLEHRLLVEMAESAEEDANDSWEEAAHYKSRGEALDSFWD